MWERVVRRASCGMLPKAFANIKPGKAQGARLTSGIIDNGLEEKSMFIASFAWACTFLLIGKEVMLQSK